MIALDHLIITTRDLETGAAAIEQTLGLPLAPGGQHPHMGTHNRLLSLGPEIYLEVIAINPDAPGPKHPRWYGLDDIAFSELARLNNWACRTDDLDALLATAPPGTGAPLALTRGDMNWHMAIPETGHLPFDDMSPGLLSWAPGSPHPCQNLPDIGARLKQLDVIHPEADALVAAFPALGTLELVSIQSGPAPKLAATLDTPNGPRRLM